MIQEIEKIIVKASQIYPAVHQKPYLDGGIFGYKLAVDKACEWLELIVCNAYNFRGDDISIGFVEQFRKAMESGCSEFPNNSKKGE